ncbi:MAG: NAD(P)/FAD-dependent oxidoreductase, partial [Candidatus Aenigmatarchaeota archaeon]
MDIKIVGGGAAGLISALYLRKLDKAEITVYEKQTRDSYESTPCGEGISFDKISELREETGFDSFPHVSKEVRGIELICPNMTSSYVHKEGAVLNRDGWQRTMIEFLEERGVQFRFDQEIESSDDLDYDILVGAEGPVSKIRQEIGGSIDVFSSVQYKMKLDRSPDYLEFYADKMFDGGYGWVFPKEKMANVGCEGSFKRLDRFLEKYDIDGEIIEKQAYPIGVSGTKQQEGSIYIIGGAGGLTNA